MWPFEWFQDSKTAATLILRVGRVRAMRKPRSKVSITRSKTSGWASHTLAVTHAVQKSTNCFTNSTLSHLEWQALSATFICSQILIRISPHATWLFACYRGIPSQANTHWHHLDPHAVQSSTAKLIINRWTFYPSMQNRGHLNEVSSWRKPRSTLQYKFCSWVRVWIRLSKWRWIFLQWLLIFLKKLSQKENF